MIPVEKPVNGDVIDTSILQQITIENHQNTYTIVYLGSLSTKTPSSPEFVIMCHIFMPQCSKHLLREILPVNHIFGL